MVMRTNDPQTVATGTIKEGPNGDLLVIPIRLGFFELVVLANIPAEGEKSAPAYVKWKINFNKETFNKEKVFAGTPRHNELPISSDPSAHSAAE